MSDTIQLADVPVIPDLSSVGDEAPFENGWYEGTILERREFTDRNGNDRIFESSDVPSASGDSRNIRLQIKVRRSSDNREMFIGHLTNYRPEDLTQQTIEAVIADKAKPDSEKDPSLRRSILSLQKLAKLQKVAGVRQFQRNGNGGLELSPLYNKTAYFRLGDDERSGGKYKEVKDIRDTRPTKAQVL